MYSCITAIQHYYNGTLQYINQGKTKALQPRYNEGNQF